ncbi:MAG: T9SS type A sorting domain-containing protein [Chitinophagaceae bacterium]
MRKIFYLFFMLLSTTAFSQTAFTPGNLVITRVGAGISTLSSKSAPVYLVEITPSGNVVQTITIPFLDNMLTPGNNKLVTQGSSSNDANISLSGDGRFFVVAGYNCDTTITSPSSSSPKTQRTIARISMAGVVNTSTLMDTVKNTSNSRMAATNDGTGFWQIGAAGGVRYVPFGCTGIYPTDSAVTISTTVNNLRTIQTYGGDLYIGGASGTVVRAGKIPGFPTTNTGTAISILPGTSTALTANTIFLTSLPGGPAGLNTMYIADDGTRSGIKKYALNATTGNWDSLGIIDAGGAYRALTASVSGSNVTLYAVKASSPLIRFADISGYGVAPTVFTAPFDTVYKASLNTALRGVQLVPSTVLPLRLLSFNAAKNSNGTAKVFWTVNGDYNVVNYAVEKSTNGKDFTAIGNVKAAGLTNYEFTDNVVIEAANYYRVKFENNDGSSTYSNVVKVTALKSIKLAVFPNPVKSNLVVSFPSLKYDAAINVLSLDGKNRMSFAIKAGATQASFNVSNLSKGTYLVRILDADGNSTSKTIIKD